MRLFYSAVCLFFVAVLPGIAPGPLQAQQTGARGTAAQDTAAARRAIEQRVGRPVSNSEVMERLRTSGMTRAQMRVRLQQAGYDPALADRYFDSIERGADPPRGDAEPEFVEALSRIGVTTRVPAGRADPDSVRSDSMAALRREAVIDSLSRTEIGVFGLRTFRNASSQFQPSLIGPVGPGYRVGPGDEILLVLTGDVEAAYTLDVTREGFVFIPDVGQVQVSGLTVAELRDVLYSRLGRVYSGVSRSPSATTRFQVTLGQLRTNQVFVTGDVAMPGSYTVSSVSGLFHALYQAGGPTENGSFRRVEIHRGGGVVERADLYSFLLGGGGDADVRLEHNDRIFVPPAGPQVRVEGSVRRPAIYEAVPGEQLLDVIRFAGGFRSDAIVHRVQIDRILPPNQRTPGRYRTLIDVDLTRLDTRADGRIEDGDVVHVFGVNDERRSRLWVEGGVRNPGLYEWYDGVTLWTLLNRADGLSESAYTPRAHILRLIEADGTRRLIRVSLERDAAGMPIHDVALADNDSIVILSRTELNTPEFVSISGYVKTPETYTFAEGMTLQDLILAAGGFTSGAYVLEAEISRLPDPMVRTDVTAHVYRVPLAANGAVNGGADRLPDWVPAADDFELRHGDRIFVRRAPGYAAVREVTITGEVLVPGTYVLANRNDRLSDLLTRAGGLTPQGYPAGVRIKRRGTLVAGDYERVLQRPGDRSDILLAAGDTIFVPAFDPTVAITGAVNFDARVVYVRGKSVEYYINQAGGFTDAADRRRVTILYPSGERSAVRRGVFEGPTAVRPGSQIFVPAVTEGRTGVNWDQIVGRATALLSTAATILILAQQLR
jgi:polysaccharide biosynthesis/export protein